MKRNQISNLKTKRNENNAAIKKRRNEKRHEHRMDNRTPDW